MMGAGGEAGLGGKLGAAGGPRGMHELPTSTKEQQRCLAGERSWSPPPWQEPGMGKGRKRRGGKLGVKRAGM